MYMFMLIRILMLILTLIPALMMVLMAIDFAKQNIKSLSV